MIESEELDIEIQELVSVDEPRAEVMWKHRAGFSGRVRVSGRGATDKRIVAYAVNQAVGASVRHRLDRARFWTESVVRIHSDDPSICEAFSEWLVATCPRRFRSGASCTGSILGRAFVLPESSNGISQPNIPRASQVTVRIPAGTQLDDLDRKDLQRKIVARVELDFLKMSTANWSNPGEQEPE